MTNERWDYRIDGKTGGAVRIGFLLVPVTMLTVLTVSQLLHARWIPAAFTGVGAIVFLSLLVRVCVMVFCFEVSIGRQGFYLRTTPFSGAYFRYADVKRCGEEVKTGRHSGETVQVNYFVFTETNGKTHRFLFDKAMYSREIRVLKERIQGSGR